MSDNVVFLADLEEFLADLERASSEDAEVIANQTIQQMGENVAFLARKYAPRASGELVSSIGVDHGYRESRVYASAPHAVFIEFGTWRYNMHAPRAGTYEIRPRQAKALRFEAQGEVVYAKSVQHPGIQPQPFMAPALEETLEEFTEGFANVGVLLIMGKI